MFLRGIWVRSLLPSTYDEAKNLSRKVEIVTSFNNDKSESKTKEARPINSDSSDSTQAHPWSSTQHDEGPKTDRPEYQTSCAVYPSRPSSHDEWDECRQEDKVFDEKHKLEDAEREKYKEKPTEGTHSKLCVEFENPNTLSFSSARYVRELLNGSQEPNPGKGYVLWGHKSPKHLDATCSVRLYPCAHTIIYKSPDFASFYSIWHDVWGRKPPKPPDYIKFYSDLFLLQGINSSNRVDGFFVEYMGSVIEVQAKGPEIMKGQWHPNDVVLVKVARTSENALLDGRSDDEGTSTEAQRRAIVEVLGNDKRNEVLTALFMVGTDVSFPIRQAALQMWEATVASTPKALKKTMSKLINTLITTLASLSFKSHQVVGRALVELVRNLGERVLILVIPILSKKGLKDYNSSGRHVYIGLSEVMASVGECLLITFMDELIPALRKTFRTTLFGGMTEIRGLIEVVGAGLNVHLSSGLLVLLSAMGDDDHTDLQGLAMKAAEIFMMVNDDDRGIEYLILELLREFVTTYLQGL